MKSDKIDALIVRILDYVNDTSVIKKDNINEIAEQINSVDDILDRIVLINYFVRDHNRRIHLHPSIFNIVLNNYSEAFDHLSHKFYRSLWDHQLLEIKKYIILNDFPISDFINMMNRTWFIDHRGQDYTLELFYSDIPNDYRLGVII